MEEKVNKSLEGRNEKMEDGNERMHEQAEWTAIDWKIEVVVGGGEKNLDQNKKHDQSLHLNSLKQQLQFNMMLCQARF